jgi:hypothetical protein
MTLQDVKERSQFAVYYTQNNLNTAQDKINNLRDVMKIIGIRYERGKNQEEEVLTALEESALLGHWMAT